MKHLAKNRIRIYLVIIIYALILIGLVGYRNSTSLSIEPVDSRDVLSRREINKTTPVVVLYPQIEINGIEDKHSYSGILIINGTIRDDYPIKKAYLVIKNGTVSEVFRCNLSISSDYVYIGPLPHAYTFTAEINTSKIPDGIYTVFISFLNEGGYGIFYDYIIRIRNQIEISEITSSLTFSEIIISLMFMTLLAVYPRRWRRRRRS